MSRPAYARRSRLALAFSLMLCGTLSLYAVSAARLAFLPPSALTSVDAHRLFESLARALEAAGEEVVALRRGNASSAALSSSRYKDGSAEAHTLADARSHEILSRVGAAFPRLSVVDEEGAAADAGLGRDFLRHIARTRALVYVLDAAGADPRGDLRALQEELRLYDARLPARPSLVVANKCDLPGATPEALAALRAATRLPVLPVSALTREGVAELLQGIRWLIRGVPQR